MDNDSIFIPAQILTVLIALFYDFITLIPLIIFFFFKEDYLS